MARMNGRERGDVSPNQPEIPIITEDFIAAFRKKFPSQHERYPVVAEMDRQMAQNQSLLYWHIQEEAVKALHTRVPHDQLAEAMGRIKFVVVDMYSILCEQRQFDNHEFSNISMPDETKIIRVTPRSITRYNREAGLYLRRTAENRGEAVGPRERILTYLRAHNPILQRRITSLLGSPRPEYRVSATTCASMLAVIAMQAKQAPFRK